MMNNNQILNNIANSLVHAWVVVSNVIYNFLVARWHTIKYIATRYWGFIVEQWRKKTFINILFAIALCLPIFWLAIALVVMALVLTLVITGFVIKCLFWMVWSVVVGCGWMIYLIFLHPLYCASVFLLCQIGFVLVATSLVVLMRTPWGNALMGRLFTFTVAPTWGRLWAIVSQLLFTPIAPTTGQLAFAVNGLTVDPYDAVIQGEIQQLSLRISAQRIAMSVYKANTQNWAQETLPNGQYPRLLAELDSLIKESHRLNDVLNGDHKEISNNTNVEISYNMSVDVQQTLFMSMGVSGFFFALSRLKGIAVDVLRKLKEGDFTYGLKIIAALWSYVYKSVRGRPVQLPAIHTVRGTINMGTYNAILKDVTPILEEKRKHFSVNASYRLPQHVRNYFFARYCTNEIRQLIASHTSYNVSVINIEFYIHAVLRGYLASMGLRASHLPIVSMTQEWNLETEEKAWLRAISEGGFAPFIAGFHFIGVDLSRTVLI